MLIDLFAGDDIVLGTVSNAGKSVTMGLSWDSILNVYVLHGDNSPLRICIRKGGSCRGATKFG
jgi:hypothetical protein